MSVARTLIKTREYQIMSPAALTYKHPSYNGFNVQQALDWIFTILYPNTKDTVETPADLPLEGNEVGDYRLVKDDGDGKWAGYRWYHKESDAEPKWYKVHDMDWTTDGVMTAFNNIAQDLYVSKDGRQDTDADGNPITGTFAGQSIYGGTDANSNLTLHANSGDDSDLPEDQTGYIQFHGNVRPTSDDTFDLGTATERFRDLFFTRNLTDGTTYITLDELIDAFSHAISLGNPHETTYDELDERIGTLTVDGDATGSVDLSSSGNKTLTLEVEDDSHYHTTDTISDFDTAVYENLKGGLVDGDNYSWEFDDEFEQVELKLDHELRNIDAPTDGKMLMGDSTDSKWKAVDTTIELSGDLEGSASYNPTAQKWELEAGVKNAPLEGIEGISLDNRTFTSVAGNPTVVTAPAHGLTTGNIATFYSDEIQGNYIVSVIDANTFSISHETLSANSGHFIPERSQLLYNPTSGEFEVASSGASMRLGELSGLDEDVLDQYVNKDGRTGGQTIHGGVSEAQNLVLKSTSHASKGNILTDSNLAPETASGADLGTPILPWKDLVMTGEAKGLRAEQVAALPTASSATKGRIVDYEGALWVNNGTQYVRIGSGDLNVHTVSANYTVTKDNDVILADGTFTITLPTPSAYKKRLVVINIGAGEVTVTGGAALIDSDNYALLFPKEAIELINNGTRWFIIPSGASKGGESPDIYRYLPKMKPILNLDFANSKTLDPRITFERASKATRVNEFGLIEEVEAGVPRFDHDPETLECKGLLIEESRTNLLTHSNDFNQPQWESIGISVIPNATVAPDGSLTATRLIEDTSDSRHALRINISVTSGTTYTVSFFVKNNGKTLFSINPADTNFGSQAHAYFNLVTGQVISGETGTGSIQALSNDWYRCSYTVTATGTGGSNFYIEFKEGTGNYVGDGTSGIYIWGAQLEVGSFPTSTLPSVETFTSRASTATYIDSTGKIATAAIDEARYSYNPENLNVPPKLLLEGESTNLWTNSRDLNLNSTPLDVDITTDTSDSVITGNKALKIQANSVSDIHTTRARFSSLTPSAIYTISYLVKRGAASDSSTRIFINDNTSSSNQVNTGYFDLVNGTWLTESLSGGVGFTYLGRHAQKLASGYYRLSITFSSTFTDIQSRLYVARGTNPNFVGTADDFILADGAQLEEGYLSSYIPTTSAPVTRSADVYTSVASTRAADLASITGANFSSWYNQSEGTFVAKGSVGSDFSALASVSDGTGSNRIVLESQINVLRQLVTFNGALQSNPSLSYTYGTTANFSAAYKVNDVTIAKDGTLGAIDSDALIPTVNRLYIGMSATGAAGWANGHISRLAYYPKRLTNNEVQAVTK